MDVMEDWDLRVSDFKRCWVLGFSGVHRKDWGEG